MTLNLPGGGFPVLFLPGPGYFLRGLAKRYCSFLLINDYFCRFAETRCQVGRGGYCVVFVDLEVQKRLTTYF